MATTRIPDGTRGDEGPSARWTRRTPAGVPPIVVLGLESRYAFDILDLIAAAELSLAACVPSAHDSTLAGDFPRLLERAALDPAGLACVIPLLTPGRRKLRVAEAEALGLAIAPPIIHPSAVVSPSVELGDGALIGAGAVIAPNVRAGAQLMVNRAASVGHDGVFGDYCTVGPGATFAGGVVLEDGAYVGAGAVLCPKVRIGRNAVVGAGAVVTRDVEPNTVVVGNPARVMRRGIAGYRDIGV